MKPSEARQRYKNLQVRLLELDRRIQELQMVEGMGKCAGIYICVIDNRGVRTNELEFRNSSEVKKLKATILKILKKIP